MKMSLIGQEWSIRNTITGDVTIQPRKLNYVICSDKGKVKEYWHLIKGPDKEKWTKAMYNKIGRIFQGIRYIKGMDT